MSKKLLRVQSLTAVYPAEDTQATAGIYELSFNIDKGQCLGLAGFSGCGKSTAAKALMGLLPLTGGSIYLDEQAVDFSQKNCRRSYYRQVQLIMQETSASFHPLYSIGSAIDDALRHSEIPASQRQRQLLQLLEQVELPAKYAQKRPQELSGGEIQRAALARALAFKPRLLICDEITSSLDVLVQQQIITLLHNLRREYQLSLLFISHDLALIQELCQELLIMHQGHIVEAGSADNILRRPQHPAAKNLLRLAQKFSL